MYKNLLWGLIIILIFQRRSPLHGCGLKQRKVKVAVAPLAFLRLNLQIADTARKAKLHRIAEINTELL